MSYPEPERAQNWSDDCVHHVPRRKEGRQGCGRKKTVIHFIFGLSCNDISKADRAWDPCSRFPEIEMPTDYSEHFLMSILFLG